MVPRKLGKQERQVAALHRVKGHQAVVVLLLLHRHRAAINHPLNRNHLHHLKSQRLIEGSLPEGLGER
jgi:hypothetical protein